MIGAVIPNEVDATAGMKQLQESWDGPAKVFAVIAAQAATAHIAVLDVEQGQEVDGAMVHILEFLTFDLARKHELPRIVASY